MTLSHGDANARLLELVYGEAAPAERALLEAHVATCARCTADLAALGDTRARLRAALDDADEPVPARAHARILDAANAAVAAAANARAGDRAAPAPAPATSPARQASAPRAPSLWERLRGRWTFPTLATVGAVAVVVIASKVFLEPERTMEAGREVATGSTPPMAESPPPATAPAEEPRAAELRLDPILLDKLSDAAAK
ncbi:MAG TPA: zf-HC2 domain-containing protein, partial [Polyangia bacterium]|nr:zf-HC2 domain-containing protein [Polyangia bacterium]